MDLERLKQDWKEHPCLRIAACDSVEELAEHLIKTHKYLMSDRSMLFGYLYQQQTRRLREVTKELEDVRSKQETDRR